MKAFTDIEQSKKLAKILPLKSADMYYLIKRDDCRVSWEEAAKDDTNVILFTRKVMSGNLSDYKLPCWSLAALLDVLQKTAYSINEDANVMLNSDKTVEWDLEINNSNLRFIIETNPIDACVNMIITLHEQKLLTNE